MKRKRRCGKGVRTVFAAVAFLLSLALLTLTLLCLYQITVWKNGQGLSQALPFAAYEGLWITVFLSLLTAAGAARTAVQTWTQDRERFPLAVLLLLPALLLSGFLSLSSAADVLKNQYRRINPTVAVFGPQAAAERLDRSGQIEYHRVRRTEKSAYPPAAVVESADTRDLKFEHRIGKPSV